MNVFSVSPRAEMQYYWWESILFLFFCLQHILTSLRKPIFSLKQCSSKLFNLALAFLLKRQHWIRSQLNKLYLIWWSCWKLVHGSKAVISLINSVCNLILAVKMSAMRWHLGLDEIFKCHVLPFHFFFLIFFFFLGGWGGVVWGVNMLELLIQIQRQGETI